MNPPEEFYGRFMAAVVWLNFHNGLMVPFRPPVHFLLCISS